MPALEKSSCGGPLSAASLPQGGVGTGGRAYKRRPGRGSSARPNASCSVAVVAGVEADLAAEHPVNEDEIPHGDGHPRRPPVHAVTERILARAGVVDGQAVR